MTTDTETSKTAKEQVREMLDRIPDDVSLEDIQYHLYVRQKIERSLQAEREGRVVSHEEVKRRMSRRVEQWPASLTVTDETATQLH